MSKQRKIAVAVNQTKEVSMVSAVKIPPRKCQPKLGIEPRIHFMAIPEVGVGQEETQLSIVTETHRCYSRAQAAIPVGPGEKTNVVPSGRCLPGGSRPPLPPPITNFNTWAPMVSGLVAFEQPDLDTPVDGLLTKEEILTGGLRYLQHYFATVGIIRPVPVIILDNNETHRCTFCTCDCASIAQSIESSLDMCNHCQYYSESYPGWCLKEHGETSGSIAYLLRNAIRCEVPATALEDKRFRSFLRLFPLNFSMIEEIRRLFREQPFDCRSTASEEIEIVTGFPDNLDVETALQANGYAGYRKMLTNEKSTVTPHSRDLWDMWVRTPLNHVFDVRGRALKRVPILGRALSNRRLHYVLTEVDPATGTRVRHVSPRMPFATGYKHIRLGLTLAPAGENSARAIVVSSKPVGTYRVYVDRRGATTQLHQDDEKIPCPLGTTKSSPLRLLYPGGVRHLYYVIEGEGASKCGESSDILQLGEQDRYLRIYLS